MDIEEEFGENPDPRKERYERYLAGQVFFRREAERLVGNHNLNLLASPRKVIRENLNYQSFYEEGKLLNCNDFGGDSKEKGMLLEEKFPRRFGKNGKQSLDVLDDLQLGSLFKNMMIYSGRRINQ